MSDHYADQIDAWAANETFPWPFTPAATDKAAEERLTLSPAAGP
jgi:penicillin amidase